jgi:hypothetical protein
MNCPTASKPSEHAGPGTHRAHRAVPIMMPSMHRAAHVETLLNTLEAERYMRGPLLRTIVDELRAREGLEPAANAAAGILEGLASGDLGESDFAARIRSLRHLVRELSEAPESGVRVKEVPDALARAVPRAATASAA